MLWGYAGRSNAPFNLLPTGLSLTASWRKWKPTKTRRLQHRPQRAHFLRCICFQGPLLANINPYGPIIPPTPSRSAARRSCFCTAASSCWFVALGSAKKKPGPGLKPWSKPPCAENDLFHHEWLKPSLLHKPLFLQSFNNFGPQRVQRTSDACLAPWHLADWLQTCAQVSIG